MTIVELYLALAAFFGSTLTVIMYYRESGRRLENSVSDIVKEKKQIVTNSYLTAAQKVIKDFRPTQPLSHELGEELENISYTRYRLSNLPDALSEVVDRLTFSFANAFASVVSILGFAYMLEASFNSELTFWMQIVLGALTILFAYRYIIQGLGAVRALRKFEKLVNAIDRSERIEQLYELL